MEISFKKNDGHSGNCKKSSFFSEKGFSIVLAVFAAFAATLFIITISKISQSSRSRISRINKVQNSFLIAHSVISKFFASLYHVGWNQRSFLNGPYKENNVSLLGGEYDLYIENTPGRTFQADVYIRTRFTDLTKLFFWRVSYRSDLLDVSNRLSIILASSISPSYFPKGQSSSFAEEVDKLLDQRKRNQDQSDELAVKILNVSDVRDVVSIIGGNPTNQASAGSFVKRDPGLTLDFPSIPSIPFPDDNPESGYSDALETADRGKEAVNKASAAATRALTSAAKAQTLANSCPEAAAAAAAAQTAADAAQAASNSSEAAAGAYFESQAMAKDLDYSGAFKTTVDALVATENAAAEATAAAEAADKALADAERAVAEARAAAQAGFSGTQ